MKALSLYIKMKSLLKNEEGVTAIEYGLIAGLIAILIIAAVTTAGESLQAIFEAVATALSAAIGGQ